MHDSQGRAAPERDCRFISKTPSTSVLQHLCNTFNSCVQYNFQLHRNNNVASKVLCGKMLPYQPNVSEAKEKTEWLKMQAIML